MEPELTAVRGPVHLRIADDIRVKIEKGELQPGDPLPPNHEIADQWGCSVTSVRGAIALLKQQGLITGGRGRPPVVREPPRRVVLTSARHQEEKDRVLAPEAERRDHGEAEDVLRLALKDTEFRPSYSFVPAGENLAQVFGVEPGEELLRKQYETRDKSGWTRYAYSVSYTPVRLWESRPDLLSESCEPWWGGHQHQLREVGIELARIVDQVKARMPTTAEATRWALNDGVPLLCVRRISIDTTGQVVEVSDAQYPADRTELEFPTELRLWSK